MRIRINLLVLEGFARGYRTRYIYEANAKLRYLITHELHHFYNLHRFPEKMSRGSGIDPFRFRDEYILNRSEIAAHLFAIRDLRVRPEIDQRQQIANFEVADFEEKLLDKNLRKVRRKKFIKNLPKNIFKVSNRLIKKH